MSKELTKKQVIALAKKHGLHVTENHNAANAAKDLYRANQRIVELEAIVATPALEPLWFKLIANYEKKWGDVK